MLTYFQAIIMGVLQGISELFPVSSLGHSVLLPTLFGWTNLVKVQSQPESFFLAFLVGLHVATALALLIFYWKQWRKIILGFFRTLTTRKIQDKDERLAWLLVIATIPAGIVGVVLEHSLRVLFAKPLAAACFLVVNGAILLFGEYLIKAVSRTRRSRETEDFDVSSTSEHLRRFTFANAFLIGLSQTLALIAGISRSGITMVGGLWRGLSREDAIRFSFLLATPIILGAGVYKLPDLFGPLGNGVRMQILVGSLCAGAAAYLAVRFLDKYFQSKTLKPFAYYCIVFGVLMIIKIH